jgi:phosphoserine phosphatase
LQISNTPTHLTTADFHAAVLTLNPKVAVFDCDGTLWSGDAGSAFMRWSMETHLLPQPAIDWLLERYDGYRQGNVSELEICGEMVQVYAGLPVDVLRAAAAEFFRTQVEHNIFPELATLIATLQQRGCDIWAVSSTNNWVIEEGVKRFHIPANRVLAARVATTLQHHEEIVTRELIDVPTDEGKVTAINLVGLSPDCVFGNSVHDAAMLAIAGSGRSGAFPVNPTPALLQHSAAHGWPVYYPASVAP